MHKQAQRGKTLVRKAVSRPQPLKTLSKTISSRSLGQVSPARLTRAADIRRSSKISRYGSPAAKRPQHSAAAPGEVIAPSSAIQTPGTLVLSKPLPSMVTSVSHQRLERMLDEALAKADAHKKMLKQLQKRSLWKRLDFLPKRLTIIVMTIGLAAAIGLFVWQKIPGVSMKLAASKAKVNASLPAYKPQGFSIQGPVKYQRGAVVVQYQASGSQSYSVTQKASDWDSVSLAANSIPSNTPVQTSQVKGTTVYIYGPSNDATWVSNGVRYTIDDKANLSSDQIIKIANSL